MSTGITEAMKKGGGWRETLALPPPTRPCECGEDHRFAVSRRAWNYLSRLAACRSVEYAVRYERIPRCMSFDLVSPLPRTRSSVVGRVFAIVDAGDADAFIACSLRCHFQFGNIPVMIAMMQYEQQRPVFCGDSLQPASVLSIWNEARTRSARRGKLHASRRLGTVRSFL